MYVGLWMKQSPRTITLGIKISQWQVNVNWSTVTVTDGELTVKHGKIHQTDCLIKDQATSSSMYISYLKEESHSLSRKNILEYGQKQAWKTNLYKHKWYAIYDGEYWVRRRYLESLGILRKKNLEEIIYLSFVTKLNEFLTNKGKVLVNCLWFVSVWCSSTFQVLYLICF